MSPKTEEMAEFKKANKRRFRIIPNLPPPSSDRAMWRRGKVIINTKTLEKGDQHEDET